MLNFLNCLLVGGASYCPQKNKETATIPKLWKGIGVSDAF